MNKILLLALLFPAILNAQNDLSYLKGFKELPMDQILIYKVYLYPITHIMQYQDEKTYDMTAEYTQKFVKTDFRNDKISLLAHAGQDIYIIKKAYTAEKLLDVSVNQRYNCIRYICEKQELKVYLEYRYYYNIKAITWEFQSTPLRITFKCGDPKILDQMPD